MESVLAVFMGLGLAASCGLRVFLPMLVVGVGARVGVIHPHESMAWLSSWPALLAFGAAAMFEAAAAMVPWVDHALDAVAGPAALLAGALVAGSAMADLHPGLGWIATAVAGASGAAAAGVVKTTSIAVRGTSTAASGGLLNPIISAVESTAAAVLSFLSAAVPLIVGALALAAVAWILCRRTMGRRAALSRG